MNPTNTREYNFTPLSDLNVHYFDTFGLIWGSTVGKSQRKTEMILNRQRTWGGMIHRIVPVSTTWLPLFKEMQGWRIILGFNKEIYWSQHSSPPLATALSSDIQLCEHFFFLRWRVSHKPTMMHERFSHWQFFHGFPPPHTLPVTVFWAEM